MEMTLRTFYTNDTGTASELYNDGKFLCYTVEREWRNNERMESCIPEGKYKIVIVQSPKFGKCLCVSGVPNRSAILIHSANIPKTQLNGCIAPVNNIQLTGSKKIVTGTDSKSRVTIINDLLFPIIEKGGEVWLNVKRNW